MEISFRNKSPNKGKVPFIIFRDGEDLYMFKGIAIAGIVSVIDRHYYSPKDAVYTLKVNKNVNVYPGNKLMYSDDSYSISLSDNDSIVTDIKDVMKALDVTEAVAVDFVSKHWKFII